MERSAKAGAFGSCAKVDVTDVGQADVGPQVLVNVGGMVRPVATTLLSPFVLAVEHALWRGALLDDVAAGARLVKSSLAEEPGQRHTQLFVHRKVTT